MNLSILKSDKKNLNSFIAVGSSLIFIGFIDIILSSFLKTNITAFLPDKISYLGATIIIIGSLVVAFRELNNNKPNN